MKIIMPEFVLSVLASPMCDFLHGRGVFDSCDFVVIDSEGQLTGDLVVAEIVMLPWGGPQAVVERILGVFTLRWVQTMSAGIDHA